MDYTEILERMNELLERELMKNIKRSELEWFLSINVVSVIQDNTLWISYEKPRELKEFNGIKVGKGYLIPDDMIFLIGIMED